MHRVKVEVEVADPRTGETLRFSYTRERDLFPPEAIAGDVEEQVARFQTAAVGRIAAALGDNRAEVAARRAAIEAEGPRPFVDPDEPRTAVDSPTTRFVRPEDPE